MSPSPNARNGRGQFAKGNPSGPGNPQARRVGQLRSMLLRTVKPKDMRTIVRSLIAKAKAGDVTAIRELLDRTLGRPTQAVDVSAEVTNPRDSLFTDPTRIDYGYQRWIVEQLQRFARLPYEVTDGPFDPNYAEYCRGLIAQGETLPPPIGERIEVVHVDDWYGSAAASRSTIKALGSP